MKIHNIMTCLTLGMLSSGVYSESFATNAVNEVKKEQEKRVLDRDEALKLIDQLNKSHPYKSPYKALKMKLGEFSSDELDWMIANKPRLDFSIPDVYTEIGEKAFAGVNGFNKIIIPNSVTSIGKHAFACEYESLFSKVYGSHFNRIDIPNSVKYIDPEAFINCDKWGCEFTVHCKGMANLLKNNCNIKEGMITIVESDEKPWWLPDDGKVEIPHDMQHIPDNMFKDRTDITSVKLPYNLISIGKDAFFRCKSLEKVIIPNGVKSIGDAAFANTGLKHVDIPNSVIDIHYNAFWWNDSSCQYIVHCHGMKRFLRFSCEMMNAQISVQDHEDVW